MYQKKDIRMTLDYEEDFQFFQNVIEHFSDLNTEMDFEKILLFLDQKVIFY